MMPTNILVLIRPLDCQEGFWGARILSGRDGNTISYLPIEHLDDSERWRQPTPDKPAVMRSVPEPKSQQQLVRKN
jgi:hypothetical protein